MNQLTGHRISESFTQHAVLVLGTLASILVPQAAWTEGGQIEEVVVVAKPIKASQLSSIEAKRNSDNLVDVVSADAIGRFPDTNLADSLGRLPGVSVERDQGRARYLNFRGAPRRYTAIAFDGIDIPGTENGRIPRFDSYPSVITSQILANKAITADMTGEAVAGYIDIKTFSPSDVEGFSGSFDYGFGEQDLGGGDVDRYSGRISYSNDAFGILVFASETSNEQVTTNLDDMDWTYTEGGIIPSRIRTNNYFVDYGNEASGVTGEFYFGDGGRIFYKYLDTEFLDFEERNQWQIDLRRIENPTPNTGYAPDARGNRALEYGKYNNTTEVQTLGTDFFIENWNVEIRASDIELKSETWLPLPYMSWSDGVTYDVSEPSDPFFTFDTPLADLQYDPIFAVFDFLNYWGRTNTENQQYKFDADTSNALGTLKLGAKFDQREALGGSAVQYQTLAQYGLSREAIKDYEQPERLWFTDVRNPIGGFYTDNKSIFDALVAGGVVFPGLEEADSDGLVTIDEEIVSLYAMQTIDTDFGSVILGLRFEDTDFSTVGWQLDAEGEEIPLSISKSYSNWLPSAHVNYDLNEDTKLRASITTAVSRPGYNEARASAGINPVNQSVAGGNPYLDPEESWGLDLAYEWYFGEASILAVSAFYREVDNVIVAGSTTVDGSVYSPAAQPGEQWTLSGSANGKNGELTGIEFNFIDRLDHYMTGPLSGFGVELNLAAIDSSFTAPDGNEYSLPGTSDLTYNASIFYEQYNFSIRLNYRYRDSWLDTTEADVGDGNYWDEQERVELSMRYDLEELTGYKAIVYADFMNLSDYEDVRYTGNVRNPNQIETYGSRYTLGIRASF